MSAVDEQRRWGHRAVAVSDRAVVRGCASLERAGKSLERLRRLLRRNKAAGVLLDLGCGNGFFTEGVSALFDEVVGVDFSREMLGRFIPSSKSEHRVLADARALPLRDEVFNTVIAVSLLQHIKPVEDVRKAVGETLRVSKRDAFVFFSFWKDAVPTELFLSSLGSFSSNVKRDLLSKVTRRRYVKFYGRLSHL